MDSDESEYGYLTGVEDRLAHYEALARHVDVLIDAGLDEVARATGRAELVARVLAATARVLLTTGARRLRTADIAARAETTESTLFRHFSSVEELLERTYAWSWAQVNEQISRAAFDNVHVADPRARL